MKLSTRQKKYLYWLISIISIFVIAMSIYHYLGGFNEIKVVQSSNNIYSVAGKEYKGRIKNDTLNVLFKEMRDLVLQKKINGELCVINFRDENLDKNEVHQFIGILLGDEISQIPAGLRVRKLEGESTFKVGLGMHPLVMPSSKKVEEIIHAYALESGVELEDFSLEILFPDNSVMVEMFVK